MPPSAAPALAVHGLQKRYGGIEALKGVDLEVQKGELVGLLGPNGAGKSTLVKIACGLVRPSGGTASIKGDPPSSPRARRSLGYLAELFRFPGWYSAAELLALHQRLAHTDGGPEERTELLGSSASRMPRDRPIDAMSKGMQQRLGIAQALIGAPRAPAPRRAHERARPRRPPHRPPAARGAPHAGIAVLLNSHLLSEIELVCDRVAIISARPPRRRRRAPRTDPRQRGRDRDRQRPPSLCEADEGGRAAARRRPRPQGRERLRGEAPPHLPRGVLPRSSGGQRGVSPVLVIARYAIQEAVRRRVFTVVLAADGGLRRPLRSRRLASLPQDRRHPSAWRDRAEHPSRAPPSSASRCSPLCSSASCSASS